MAIDEFHRNVYEIYGFRFGAVSDSYAARTSDDCNAGVIGFDFFDDRGAERHF